MNLPPHPKLIIASIALLWCKGILSATLETEVTTTSQPSISPLTTTHWHQKAPYNDLCPIIEDGHVKTAAGCVAVAAAQVAYYWYKDNPQSTLYDTPTYPYGKAPVTYSVPEGTPYKWELMRDSYTLEEPDEEQQAVARLIYVIGTSSWLKYAASTGGYINDVTTTLSQQLKLYSNYARKSDYSQEEWEQLLRNELENGRPVIYSGTKGTYGHAVVVDGYDAIQNLFHFNFGWGGPEDGYYTVDDSTGMDGYCLGQACLYGIRPRKRNVTASISPSMEMTLGESTAINVTIDCNSTLDLKTMYLFLTVGESGEYLPSEATVTITKAIPSGSGEHEFTITMTPQIVGEDCLLTLTDENMDILAQTNISIHKESVIADMETTDSAQNMAIWSLDGRMANNHSISRGSKGKTMPRGLFISNGRKWLLK